MSLDKSTYFGTKVSESLLSLSKSSKDIPFKKEHSLERRKNEAKVIMEKYPERIPIIAECHEKSSNQIQIDKKKYLVPKDLNVGQFHYVIRKRIKLQPDENLYIFCNHTMPSSNTVITQLYNEYHDEDGFLYITFAKESSFGN
jgi:GABA(A) receptor-associated protein